MKIYSRNWCIANGPAYSYFWKTGDEFGELSQWFNSPFTKDGILYPTAEHWMMSQKALLFSDNVIFQKIITEPFAYNVKALGRKIKGFDEAIWNDKKVEIVQTGNILKFTQNPKLLKVLKNSKNPNNVWVEASPYDTVWGIGLSKTDVSASIPSLWKGENLLGEILTKLKAEL
jgi:ribA/ribD-fused uncharacterized protein